MKSPKQKSMENVLHELEEMMHLLESFKGDTLNTPENLVGMKIQAEFLGQMLDAFNDLHDSLPAPSSQESLPEETQALLSESQFIEQKGKLLHESFEEALKASRKEGKGKETAAMKERKKLFKTIGGDKKWIPL